MSDLISRQAAIDTFEKELTVGESKGKYVTICSAVSYEGAKHILERVPTIDAVPVVRCKDCKHWGVHKSLNVPWCFEMHIDKSEDGYCDSGERNDE